MPQPGHPDRFLRDRLNLLLYSQPESYSILAAIQLVKQTLQQRKAVSSRLGELTWEVNSQELEAQVIHPFINQVEQQLALLLQQANSSKIDSVVCSGEAAILTHWLQQQFPEANVQGDAFKPISSLAVGLAHLPLFPGLLDRPRHQYSDYFLLVELLQAVPDSPFSFKELMQQLDKRGINTQVCAHRFRALLEGALPQGLLPTASHWLTQSSQQNPDYQITRLPLFTLTGERYQVQGEQCQRLRQYLAAILAQTQQKLQEPLVSPLLLTPYSLSP